MLLRRYRCQSCKAVIAVGPAGIAPGRLYSAMAIALALFLYGVRLSSHPEIRRQVSPWRPSAREPTRTCWVTLLRWIDAQRQGALFARMHRIADAAQHRRSVAEQAALLLVALSLSESADERERVFTGAARAL